MLINPKTLEVNNPDHAQAIAWCVAKLLGINVHVGGSKDNLCRVWRDYKEMVDARPFNPFSSDVVIALMEKFKIRVDWTVNNRTAWLEGEGKYGTAIKRRDGKTVPQAVIACALQTMDEVDVPSELMGEIDERK